MRNTTMRDKLVDLLSPETARTAKAASASSTAKTGRRATASHKPTIAEIGNRRSPNEGMYQSPRYVDPKRAKKPFSVHAYSLVTVSPQSEAEPEPAAIEQNVAEPIAIPSIPEPALSSPPPVLDEPLVLDSEPRPVLVSPLPLAAPAPIPAAPEVAAVREEPAPMASTMVEVSEEPQSQFALPPNLIWLENPTPFGGDLRSIVEKSRTAKSNVGFTLEQSIARQKELRTQIAELQRKLDQEEFLGEQQREYLRQLDEVIAACALVAEQSAGIEEVLRSAPVSGKTHADGTTAPKKIKSGRWLSDKSAMCTREDVIRFFANNTNTNWNAEEIARQLPAAKRAHAKTALPSLLSNLYHDNLVQRVGRGFYRSIEGGPAAE